MKCVIGSDCDISGFYELDSDSTHNLYTALYSLLSYTPPAIKKLQSLCLAMQIAITEFISIIEEQFDASNPFLSQLLALSDTKEWNLKFRLINLSVDLLSHEQRLAVIDSLLQTIQTLSASSLLQSLSSCYAKFNELSQQQIQDQNQQEEIMDDAVATAMMEEEALDGGKPDNEGEIISESEIIQQQIVDYRVLLDVLSHLLQPEQYSLQLGEQHVSQLVAFVQAFIAELENCNDLPPHVHSLRYQLLSGIIDVESSILPYLSAMDMLLSIWSSLVKYLSISLDVTSAIIRCFWTWSQIVINHSQYSDAVNPVCFADQIAPLTSVLSVLSSDELVQTIRMITTLLQPVTPAEANLACVTEVCNQTVHVLDNPANASNPEVIGNVLDFVMTMWVISSRKSSLLFFSSSLLENLLGNLLFSSLLLSKSPPNSIDSEVKSSSPSSNR